MSENLTQKLIQGLEFSGKGRAAQYVYDSGVVGLAVRIYPSGKKAFVVHYRHLLTRKWTYVVLGSTDHMTVVLARQEARKYLGQVAAGVDPSDARREASAASAEERRRLTVAELCDLFLSEYATRRRKGALKDDKSRIRRHIKPALGTIPADDLRRADVARLYAKIGETHETTANRVVTLLSAIYNWGIQMGYLDEDANNPTSNVRKFEERSRERYPTHREAVALLKVADADEDRLIGLLIRL